MNHHIQEIYKNLSLSIVCIIVAVAPMLRGAVHLWAETLIQIAVLIGLIPLLLENMLTARVQKEHSTKMVWYIVLPCALLGIFSTLFSSNSALAMEGLMMLLTYLAFFYLVFESIRTRQDQRILVWVIIGTAFFLCIIGLLKRFDILLFPWWDYAGELKENHGSTSLSGVYVNRNHMAGFLEMSIPLILGLFLTRSRSLEVRIRMILLTLFLIICQVLTLSRGGWAATVGAMVFMMLTLLLMKGFQQKRLLITIAVGVVVVTLIILVSTPVVQRITTLTEKDMEDNISGRLIYWASTWNMIQDNILTGTGPGTFTEASPAYLKPGLAVLPLYAHNDYLHFIADSGIFVIPLMLWLVGLFFRTGFRKLKSRSRQTTGIILGCMASVVAILIHSFSDFNLHIPANITLFTTITALVFRIEA